MANRLRAGLGQKAILYTNECSVMSKWPAIPAALDYISIDFYDERNTDEAWVSVKVEHFHDEADVFGAFNFHDPRGVAECAWLTLHRDVDLHAEQEDLCPRCYAAGNVQGGEYQEKGQRA